MTDINVDLEAILQSKITFNIDLQSTEEVLEAMTAAIRADREGRGGKVREIMEWLESRRGAPDATTIGQVSAKIQTLLDEMEP